MNIVTRAEWKARRPRSRTHLGTSRGTAVHWLGPGIGNIPHSKCAETVRGIQNFHMDTRKWSDIAYSFLVCPHGTIFEGRGWGVRTAANGTNYGNANYHAACYLGGAGDTFTDPAKAAYVWLRGEHRKRFGTDGLRTHRSLKPTECPGDVIAAWVATDPTGNIDSAPNKEWDEMASQAEIEESFRKVLREGDYIADDGTDQYLIRENAGLAVKIKTKSDLESLSKAFPSRGSIAGDKLKGLEVIG